MTVRVLSNGDEALSFVPATGWKAMWATNIDDPNPPEPWYFTLPLMLWAEVGSSDGVRGWFEGVAMGRNGLVWVERSRNFLGYVFPDEAETIAFARLREWGNVRENRLRTWETKDASDD